jgi:hypothetical protein
MTVPTALLSEYFAFWQHDGAARIVAHDVERVLANIDADHGDRGI